MDRRALLFMLCVTLSFWGVQTVFRWWDPPSTAATQEPLLPVPSTKPQEILPLPVASGDETFYVLENEYQQLVFSTHGGSLVEINLPFHSASHPNSLVKEIDFDRLILKQSPQNARFPLRGYYTAPRTFHEEGTLGGYYPLLRRPILRPDGTAASSLPSPFRSFAVLGAENLSYRVTHFDKNQIQFEGSSGSRRIRKTFTLPSERAGPYCVDVEIEVQGEGADLWVASGVPDVELIGGSYAPLLKIQTLKNHQVDVEALSLPQKEPLQELNILPNWINNSNGFFGLLMDPLSPTQPGYFTQKVEGDLLPTRLTLIDSAYHLYPAGKYPGYLCALPLKANTPLQFRFFAGPLDHALLKELDALYDDPLKHYNPEYSLAQSIQGWFSFISQPFAKFLFFLMQLFHNLTSSWAAAILLVTISLRAMMYPLTNWSIRSTQKMQKVNPQVKALQERYKKDPRKAQMEIMLLYRKEGINPMMGCLPMILQMPFLIGMFYLLKSSFPLRGALFIPGWIDDLAAPDVLFSWGQPLWFIGNSFHLLPFLMGAAMLLQQRLSSPLPTDPQALTDAQKQQKTMSNLMAGLFTVMLYHSPSGLNLYFMFSTLLGVLQQWWVSRKRA